MRAVGVLGADHTHYLAQFFSVFFIFFLPGPATSGGGLLIESYSYEWGDRVADRKLQIQEGSRLLTEISRVFRVQTLSTIIPVFSAGGPRS